MTLLGCGRTLKEVESGRKSSSHCRHELEGNTKDPAFSFCLSVQGMG